MRHLLLICTFGLYLTTQGQQIFSNLKASQLGDSIFVQWTLLANYTCNDMILERSVNGGVYKPIFSVAGICGASIDLNYQFLDGTNLQTSQTYSYRVSASNGFYTSSPVSVIFNSSGEGDVLIFPNPASSQFYVSVNNNLNLPYYAEIFAVDGKLLWGSLMYDHLNEISTTLNNGIYLIRILTDDGFARYAYFIIQR